LGEKYFDDKGIRKCSFRSNVRTRKYKHEDVEFHAHNEGGDILNFTYCNLLPRPSSQVEKMGGVFFFVKFVIAIPLVVVVFKPLPHLPSPCEKVGWGIFFT